MEDALELVVCTEVADLLAEDLDVERMIGRELADLVVEQMPDAFGTVDNPDFVAASSGSRSLCLQVESLVSCLPSSLGHCRADFRTDLVEFRTSVELDHTLVVASSDLVDDEDDLVEAVDESVHVLVQVRLLGPLEAAVLLASWF